MRPYLFFILCAAFVPFVTFAHAEETPETVPSAEVSDAPSSNEASETIFLELFWYIDDVPREALLMVPKDKVPMIYVRVLTSDETLAALVGEQVTISTDEDAVVLECSAPKVLFGSIPEEKYVPEIFILESDGSGALEQNGKKAPCVLNPVTPENFPKILEKYTVPEVPES